MAGYMLIGERLQFEGFVEKKYAHSTQDDTYIALDIICESICKKDYTTLQKHLDNNASADCTIHPITVAIAYKDDKAMEILLDFGFSSWDDQWFFLTLGQLDFFAKYFDAIYEANLLTDSQLDTLFIKYIRERMRKNPNLSFVQSLFTKGVNPNRSFLIFSGDEPDRIPDPLAFRVAKDGSFELFKLFIDFGFDLQKTGENGTSILRYLAQIYTGSWSDEDQAVHQRKVQYLKEKHAPFIPPLTWSEKALFFFTKKL